MIKAAYNVDDKCVDCGNPRNVEHLKKCAYHPSKWTLEHGEHFVSKAEHDAVNHPKHYTNHPSGIECIQITRHMGFNLGNAMKYIWRADLKNGLEDLEKAIWYIKDEISKRTAK